MRLRDWENQGKACSRNEANTHANNIVLYVKQKTVYHPELYRKELTSQ